MVHSHTPPSMTKKTRPASRSPIRTASFSRRTPKPCTDVSAFAATTCFSMTALRFPLTDSRSFSRKMTAGRISRQSTRSGQPGSFFFFPRPAPRWRAGHPSAMTMSVSSGPAAFLHRAGRGASRAASPGRSAQPCAAPPLNGSHAASPAAAAFS
jgi:hypothetical protein